jgi:hypothetical protein
MGPNGARKKSWVSELKSVSDWLGVSHKGHSPSRAAVTSSSQKIPLVEEEAPFQNI